jgi:hypothetical protein
MKPTLIFLWAALVGYIVLSVLIILVSMHNKRQRSKLAAQIRSRPVGHYQPPPAPARLHPIASGDSMLDLAEGWRYPALPNPVGFVTRKHRDGTLVKDGGTIVSESFLVNDQVPSTALFSQTQMWDYAEASVKRALQMMQTDLETNQSKDSKK